MHSLQRHHCSCLSLNRVHALSMFTGNTNHTTAQRHRETEKLPGEKTDSQATTAKMARKVKLLQGPKDNTHDTCTFTCCIQRIGKRPLNSGMPPCLMTVAAVATPSSCVSTANRPLQAHRHAGHAGLQAHPSAAAMPTRTETKSRVFKFQPETQLWQTLAPAQTQQRSVQLGYDYSTTTAQLHQYL